MTIASMMILNWLFKIKIRKKFILSILLILLLLYFVIYSKPRPEFCFCWIYSFSCSTRYSKFNFNCWFTNCYGSERVYCLLLRRLCYCPKQNKRSKFFNFIENFLTFTKIFVKLWVNQVKSKQLTLILLNLTSKTFIPADRCRHVNALFNKNWTDFYNSLFVWLLLWNLISL